MSTTDRLPPRRPSADALDASVRLARLRQQMFARVETTRIAQYHVLRPIGGGGMGLVFAAWDPSLDRTIAIKVLRDPLAAHAGTDLRREAIALARLRHPNVVSVFEVGDHGGQVYLAMEYVEGETLREWMRRWRAAPKRDLDRLLAVFVQLAEGLAAAHAAGVVHRDVKPENVMIDAEGRARLMDFGLARHDAKALPTAAADTANTPAFDGDTGDGRGTGLAGTPAYMAPEQFEGVRPGPAADQFALCACLFEALYGRRVRPERMQAAAATADAPIRVPALRTVPRGLQAMLRRGLAIVPGDRWPSMAALAGELRALRRPRWRRFAALGGFALMAAGVAAGVALSRPDDTICTGSAAQMGGVWDDARAEGLRARVRPSSAAFVADATARLVDELDGYRSQWIAAHRETCEAAQLRRELSSEQMDLRMACLDERRRRLDALVDVVEDGGDEELARAEQATAALPSIAACADARYVARQGYVPNAEATATAIDDALARAAALQAGGDPEAARAAAAAALAEADATANAPMAARAELTLSKAQQSLYEAVEAHRTAVQAYEHARLAGLADVAASAATELVRLSGVLSRYDEGSWWLRLAELDGADLDDPSQSVERELAAASLFDAAGRQRDALAHAEAARDVLRERVGPDDRAFASAQLDVGRLMLITGRVDEGARTIDQAAQTLRAAVGDRHPANARGELAIANARRMQGDFAAAIEHARAALAYTESAVGDDHIALAPYLESLATSLYSADRRDESLAVLDRALALARPRTPHDSALARLDGRRGDVLSLFDPAAALQAYERAWRRSRSALGDQHRMTVHYQVGRGEAMSALGRGPEAIEIMTTALSIGQSALGNEHPDVAQIQRKLALAYDSEGRHAEALEHHLAHLDALRRLHGPDAFPLVAAHNNVCVAFLQLERYAEALPHCERALAILELARDPTPSVVAELHNTHGGVLSLLGRDAEATAAFERSRAAWRTAVGPDSLEESSPMINLAEIAAKAGRDAEACALYRAVLEIREPLLGREAPGVQSARAGLAACARRPK